MDERRVSETPLAGAEEAPGALGVLGLFVEHLRLPFQLVLAPIFMLGAWLSGAHFSWPLLVAFLAVHAGIYGGMTAFNSYYDRDQGPIGFMKDPRPAPHAVRDLAIAIQLAAVLVLAMGSKAAAAGGLVLVAMGIAYSHPHWRWKASLGASLAAVSIGQGCLAFLIGYAAGGGSLRQALDPHVALPALGTAVVTLGLYPITQVYQIAEDRARGDRTLPTAIGWQRSLLFSALVVPIGLALIGLPLAPRIAPVWRWIGVPAVVVYWAGLAAWARRFAAGDTYRNHDWAMAFASASSAGFWIFVLSAWSRAGW
jgi:4-hydroxybenzoate polyprenyltransferase